MLSIVKFAAWHRTMLVAFADLMCSLYEDISGEATQSCTKNTRDKLTLCSLPGIDLEDTYACQQLIHELHPLVRDFEHAAPQADDLAHKQP